MIQCRITRRMLNVSQDYERIRDHRRRCCRLARIGRCRMVRKS